MEALATALRSMAEISDQELADFLSRTEPRSYQRRSILSRPGQVPKEIFFLVSGLVRVVVEDREGNEHTIHFGMENQFLSDYSSFMLGQPGLYTLEALEDTQVVVIPKETVDWGYENLRNGDRMGRLIAEFYFIYQDNRVKNLYSRTPKERYDSIEEVFPSLHQRVPQHMIASYLGITAVHLSRLKREAKV